MRKENTSRFTFDPTQYNPSNPEDLKRYRHDKALHEIQQQLQKDIGEVRAKAIKNKEYQKRSEARRALEENSWGEDSQVSEKDIDDYLKKRDDEYGAFGE